MNHKTNWGFATNSNFLIPKALQPPEGVDIDILNLIVRNIYGLRQCVAKIGKSGFVPKTQILYLNLNFFISNSITGFMNCNPRTDFLELWQCLTQPNRHTDHTRFRGRSFIRCRFRWINGNSVASSYRTTGVASK